MNRRKLVQLMSHRNCQPTYTLANLFWRSIGKVQPEMPKALFGESVPCVETISRNKRHFFADCVFKEFLAVHSLRQSNPQEQSALRMSPLHIFGEEFFQSCEHDIATLAIDLADEFHVSVQQAVFRDLVCHELSEGRGMQVRSLFKLNQL